MKSRLRGYRTTIIAGIVLLLLLLTFMGRGLYLQIRDLATAEDDNIQWSISQLDTEFANLQLTLSQPPDGDAFNDREINLRLDIALSRIGVLTTGRSATFFAGNDTAELLIRSVKNFANDATALVDQSGPFTQELVNSLQELTHKVRPDVRKIALLGVDIDATRSDEQRAAITHQLIQTGVTTIFLVLLMGALMLLLDRLLVRAELRDSELITSSKLLESTIAASLDAIVTANESGEIIEYNAAAENVFGWKRDEIIGLTMENTFIPQRMREAHHAGMKRYLETGVPRVVGGGRVELAALRKTGEEFPIELNITSVEDKNGTKFIAYIQDISERKITEQKLIDARDQAEKTDRAKSQFLTVMSHEMRTPLNGIMGILDLLRTTDLTPKQDRYARIATSSSEILLGLTNEALDVTRIETDSFHQSPQIFDLSKLLTALIEALEPLAREKQLNLTLHIDENMQASFFGDNNRIRQILTNLVGNAIKFTSEGNITIEAHGIHGTSETSLRISVIDTGPGIYPAHQEQIFEDFVALNHSEGRQSRGDGLGLSISRRIARKLGGDITLVSEMGKGSAFTLTVPLSRQNSEKLNKPTTQTTKPETVISSNRILIVEDNDINRKVLRDMLEGLGHVVTEAVNGVDCLERAKEQQFDLIFMDISMPIMDGIEATKQLKSGNGLNAETTIIGLTAHGHEEYREKGNLAGMNRFHTKPIRLNALRTILTDDFKLTEQETASHNGLPDELSELCAMLGEEKVKATVEAFFTEMSGFLSKMSEDEPLTGSSLADATHQQKGAASMLGQRDLAKRLANLEEAARNGRITDLAPWVLELTELADRSQVACATAFLSDADEPPLE